MYRVDLQYIDCPPFAASITKDINEITYNATNMFFHFLLLLKKRTASDIFTKIQQGGVDDYNLTLMQHFNRSLFDWRQLTFFRRSFNSDLIENVGLTPQFHLTTNDRYLVQWTSKLKQIQIDYLITLYHHVDTDNLTLEQIIW